MSKLKTLLTNTRIWIYLVLIVITIIAISPKPWNNGVTIRTVNQNSTAYQAGMHSPLPAESPMTRERIVEINRNKVNSISEYNNLINIQPSNTSLIITTQKAKLGIFSDKKTYVLNYQSAESLGLTVYEAPKSNIIFGIDLQGGTRVVLQPEEKVTKDDMDLLLRNMQERLNLFGLSDTVVRSANDLTGNQFIVVEIAGTSEQDVKDLLAKQGKFEAMIANTSVFLGGKDITYVCRTSQCSGIDPQYGCRQGSDGSWSCRFRFSISLSPEAAARQAGVTNTLNIIYDGSGQSFLDQNIDLYLDDSLVDSLRIGSELKGNPVTDISISGSGAGRSRQEALVDAQQNMKKLQTVLVTGSLPVKLNIIKTDTLSPSLGKEFLNNAILIAILAEIAVTAVIVFRYKNIKVAIPIITAVTSEIFIILGMSALFKQNLDIAGIAGIIVAIGTGVDDQIVITDELMHGSGKDKSEDESKYLTWAQRIKKAFFIVFASYVATTASMIPLLFAGAGLLKGFAITTIIGVTAGVFVTRPAFAILMEVLIGDETEK